MNNKKYLAWFINPTDEVSFNKFVLVNNLLINKENEKKILDSDINTLKLYIFNIDEFQSLVMEIPYNIERDPTLFLQKYKKSNYINQYKILECLYNYIKLLYLNKDNIDYLTNTYYYLGKYTQIEEIRSSKINEENKTKLNILIFRIYNSYSI